MMKKIIAIALCVLMLCAVLAGCGKEVVSSGTTEVVSKAADDASDNNGSAEDETLTYESKSTDPLLDISTIPEADLNAADAEYQEKAPAKGDEVAILHTNYGDISVKFFPEVAPKAINSFIALAKAGRYDQILFHRVTTAETAGCAVIQSGDYTNYNGTGGVSAYGETFGLEVSDYLRNIPGSLAMARSSDPNSNGSQFYINVADNGSLDGDYTVFGQVYDGMDVVNKIAAVERDASDKPVKDVVLKSVEVVKYS